jgi:hypothetical protein
MVPKRCKARVASRSVACARLNFLPDKGGGAPCLVAVVFHDVQRWHAYGNKMLKESMASTVQWDQGRSEWIVVAASEIRCRTWVWRDIFASGALLIFGLLVITDCTLDSLFLFDISHYMRSNRRAFVFRSCW